MVCSGGGRSGRVNVEEIFILRVRNERKEMWALFEVGNASKNLNGLDSVGFLSKVYGLFAVSTLKHNWHSEQRF